MANRDKPGAQPGKDPKDEPKLAAPVQGNETLSDDPVAFARSLLPGGNAGGGNEDPPSEKITAGEEERKPDGVMAEKKASDPDGSSLDRTTDQASAPQAMKASSPSSALPDPHELVATVAELKRQVEELKASRSGEAKPQEPGRAASVVPGGQGPVEWEGRLDKDPLAPKIRFKGPENEAEARELYLKLAGIRSTEHQVRVSRV